MAEVFSGGDVGNIGVSLGSGTAVSICKETKKKKTN